MLTVRNRFRRRWLNEDIPEVDYFGNDEAVADRRMYGGYSRRQSRPQYNVS